MGMRDMSTLETPPPNRSPLCNDHHRSTSISRSLHGGKSSHSVPREVSKRREESSSKPHDNGKSARPPTPHALQACKQDSTLIPTNPPTSTVCDPIDARSLVDSYVQTAVSLLVLMFPLTYDIDEHTSSNEAVDEMAVKRVQTLKQELVRIGDAITKQFQLAQTAADKIKSRQRGDQPASLQLDGPPPKCMDSKTQLTTITALATAWCERLSDIRIQIAHSDSIKHELADAQRRQDALIKHAFEYMTFTIYLGTQRLSRVNEVGPCTNLLNIYLSANNSYYLQTCSQVVSILCS